MTERRGPSQICRKMHVLPNENRKTRMRRIALDVETTGITLNDGHRIIEIACLEIVSDGCQPLRFYTKLNPEREIDPSATAAHGYTRQLLNDAPLFTEVAPALLSFIKGAELVIHNAPFDIGFLNAELRQARLPSIDSVCDVTDTYLIARDLHPGQINNLNALCDRYGVPKGPKPTGAQQDVEKVAQIYLMMTGKSENVWAVPAKTAKG